MKSGILINSVYKAAEAEDHFRLLVSIVDGLRRYITDPRLLIQHSLKEDKLGLMIESDDYPPIGAYGNDLFGAVTALQTKANKLKDEIDANPRTKDEPAAGKKSSPRRRRESTASKRGNGVRKR